MSTYTLVLYTLWQVIISFTNQNYCERLNGWNAPSAGIKWYNDLSISSFLMQERGEEEL